MAALRRLRDAAAVLEVTGQDPFVRASTNHPDITGWSRAGATAWFGGDGYLNALGDPPAVQALLADVAADLPPGLRATLPRGTMLEPPLTSPLVEWDFRWLSEPPPLQPAEPMLHWLTAHDELEVAALLASASPRASAHPGDPEVRRWCGVRDGSGALVACAADVSLHPDVGALAGIATDPVARGRGLGAGVTAWITRQLLAEGCDIVTLGMYADNTVGRRLYDSLGYRDEHPFTSGPLT